MTIILSDFLIGGILVIAPLLIGIILFMTLLRKLRIRKRKMDSE
jgi:hypothetical protein